MIEVQNVEVSYKDEKALNHLSLQIDRHSTYAVIGESGCGKTTLLYTLAGLIKPVSGKILINGEELVGVRQSTGLILQDFGLLPWKSVWDNIAFSLKTRGVSKVDIEQRVTSTLTNLGLLDYQKKYPGELSGGQKQRVAIGRTLALEPDLLLMDEASSALDAMTKERLQNQILTIYREKKITLVMVTHNIEEAVFLGQKIIIMTKGSIRQIIDNPYFGTENLRDTLKFYKVCLEVRKWLNEEI